MTAPSDERSSADSSSIPGPAHASQFEPGKRSPRVDPLPNRGRLAGIDFGTVRIGIAVSDSSQAFASPLKCYHRQSSTSDAIYFSKLVKSEEIVGFVVGLPMHMSGDESKKSREAREFGAWLNQQTGLPIAWVDERYTTAMAKEMLSQSNLSFQKRKQKLDKLAAQIILATYLESKCRGGCNTGSPVEDADD